MHVNFARLVLDIHQTEFVHVPLLDKQPNVSILENISVRKLETNAKSDKIIVAHAIHVLDKSEVIIPDQKQVSIRKK